MYYTRARSARTRQQSILARQAAVCSVLLLAGCQPGVQPPAATAVASSDAPAWPTRQTRLAGENSTMSPMIAELAARKSILPSGSAYESVAKAVLAAAPRLEAAELGLTRLRAKAQSGNRWPMLTPTVTLDTLAGFAASLLVEQPVLDRGRRKAERDRAAAEVDLAAVVLSMRQNERVFTGLSLYLFADEAREKAMIAEAATERITSLRQIVSARVAGGLSDLSEEQIIAQTVAEMQATLNNDRRVREQMLADLAALAGTAELGVLTGTFVVAVPSETDALSVLHATAAGTRSLAEARIARAAALPGVSLVTDVTEDRATPGLRLGGVQVGTGSAAAVAAADAATELVAGQIAEARHSAERRRTELVGRIATLRTGLAEGAKVLRRTRENLDLFTDQYSMGTRSLLDLTAQTAAVARLERDQVSLIYEIARLELELARDAGALVHGESL